MGALPGWLLRHEVTIQALTGADGYGVETYADAVPVSAFVDNVTNRVRGPGGDEVASPATVYVQRDTVAPPGSLVTLPDGRVATVITSKDRHGGGLPTPDHLELALS